MVVPGPFEQFALSPDGTWGIAIERDGFQPLPGPGRAVRFDLVRGRTEVLEHGNDVVAIALDAGGTLVATSSVDRTVRVSRASGGPSHLLLGADGTIDSLSFSPDSRWLAVGTADKTVVLLEGDRRVVSHTLSGHQDYVQAVALSPDGKLLASGSRDRNIRIWKAP